MKIRFVKSMCCMVLAMVLMVGNTLSVNAKYFEDVQSLNTEYRDAINYVSDNGYMVGTTSVKFTPEVNLTRAMVVTILYSMEGKPACTASNPFADVSSSDWYYDAVRWAYSNGIVSGVSASSFAPNLNITRVQLALMLKAYATDKKYKQGITNGKSITGSSDYGSIPSYGREAMQWAVDNHIYTMASSSARLYPNNSIARKDVALSLARFGEHVEGIRAGKDVFSFINGEDDFSNTYQMRYYVSQDDRALLLEGAKRYCDQHGISFEGAEKDLRDGMRAEWGGSCYGMIIAVALDKMGKIGFNENLNSPVATMYQVPKPKSSPYIMSRINYYQLFQSVPGFGLTKKTFQKTQLVQGYKALIQEVKENGFVHLGFSWHDNKKDEAVAHAVLVYRCTMSIDGDYLLWAYNPSEKINTSYRIKKDFSASDFVTEPLESISFTSDFSYYDTCDYDGEYNVLTSDNSEQNAMLKFSLIPEDFVLTNAEGDEIFYDSETNEFTGDLEVLAYYYTTDSFVIHVKDSDSFKLQTEDVDSKFTVIGHKVYARIEGNNIQSITVNADGTIQLDGTDMEYSISVDAYEDNQDLIEITNTASGTVILNKTE